MARNRKGAPSVIPREARDLLFALITGEAHQPWLPHEMQKTLDWIRAFVDATHGAGYTRIARLLMGLTHIKVNIANPARPRQALELSFLVDSGAVYSVVPAALLRKLRIRPHSKRTFIMADGSEITRKIGDVLFRLNGRQGAAPVIFGEKQDSTLLGTVSLEALGMMLDPMKRELRPLPMLLVSHTPSLTLI